MPPIDWKKPKQTGFHALTGSDLYLTRVSIGAVQENRKLWRSLVIDTIAHKDGNRKDRRAKRFGKLKFA